MGHLHNYIARTLYLLTQYQAISMRVIHIQRCKHKGMVPNLHHAIGRVAPGDAEISSAGIDMVFDPGRLVATTTLLQAKG